MHRMVAAKRQSGDDGVGRATRHDGPGRQRISHDPIIDLGVDRSLIHADARTACSATLDRFAKALHHIGLSSTTLVLQGYEETASMRRVFAVVPARPGVDVKTSARPSYHVASVTDVVSEDRCAKTGGQLQPAVIVRACLALGLCSPIGLGLSRPQGTAQ